MKSRLEEDEEELIKTIAGHNESAPARHRAQTKLNKIIAQKAAHETLKWTRTAAIAAIAAAILTLIQLLK